MMPTKRVLVWGIFVSLTFLTVLLYFWTNVPIRSSQLAFESLSSSSLTDSQYLKQLVLSSPEFTKEYLTEDEALQDGPLQNIDETVSIKFSQQELLEDKSVFNTGENIKVYLVLRDGYNVQRQRGGDQLRVRIYNKELKAFSAGNVIDHNDGTYTAVTRAIWPGQQTISVTLAYRRETVRAMYYLRQKILGSRFIKALFTSEKMVEETACHPVRGWLSNYSDVCNFTLLNGGAPWYCVKPSNRALLCEDWTRIRTGTPYQTFPITHAEYKLLSDPPTYFPDIHVIVKGNLSNRHNLTPCWKYPKRNQWTQMKPSGFFYNDVWKHNHCRGSSTRDYSQCLNGTLLMLTGDSTTRQWYSFILDAFHCLQYTEKWLALKWHKRSACFSQSLNFTVEWIPHAQPFFVGVDWHSNRYTMNSIARQLNELGDRKFKHIFIVIHLYVHFIALHHTVFRDRVRSISNSLRTLSTKQDNVKFLIKGPHTYASTNAGNDCFNDYFGYLYRDILKEEFAGLYDKVIYMDQKDMTIAKGTISHHPPDEVVREAVNQIFEYVCE